jgi:hypothetical protein
VFHLLDPCSSKGRSDRL